MWLNSRWIQLKVPEEGTHIISAEKLSETNWQSEYGSASLLKISTVTHCYLTKGVCYSNTELCHVLIGDSQVYIWLL